MSRLTELVLGGVATFGFIVLVITLLVTVSKLNSQEDDEDC